MFVPARLSFFASRLSIQAYNEWHGGDDGGGSGSGSGSGSTTTPPCRQDTHARWKIEDQARPHTRGTRSAEYNVPASSGARTWISEAIFAVADEVEPKRNDISTGLLKNKPSQALK